MTQYGRSYAEASPCTSVLETQPGFSHPEAGADPTWYRSYIDGVHLNRTDTRFYQAAAMSKKEQVIKKMRDWFLQNYETPIEAYCPYDYEGDRFMFIWGGPYDPLEKLSDRFSRIYKDEWIEELAKELTEQSDEWSGSPRQVS